MSKSRDGRESWKELVVWYEGQGSTETLARKALTTITTHQLTHNSFGGAESYLEKFETALQDLEEIDKPYDLAMAKIHFLTNIKDDEYKIVKENLEMDEQKTYHDCLVEIRRKSISVEADRKKGGQFRRSNRNKTGGGRRNARANNLKQKMGEFYVDPNKWKKMSREERDAHLQKRRDSQRNGPSNSKDSPVTNPPSQYSSANNATKMSVQEKELYDMMQNNANANASQTAEEELSPQQRTFLNMVRSMNQSSSSSINAMRTVQPSKHTINKPPIKTKEENVRQVLEEDWMEDDQVKYLEILHKSGALTQPESEISIPTKPLYDCNTLNSTRMYSMSNPDYESVYDGWRNGNLDAVFKGFGKKVMRKLEKAMSVSKDVNWFKQDRKRIDNEFDAEIHLPPRCVNLTRLRSMNQSHQSPNVSNYRGELLIDGGCDTTLVGKGFKIESTTARSVNVQGFNENMKINKLPIVTAVTAIDLPEETLILEFNECIHVENNTVSLLSTFQTRENGVQVYDTARRHGGKQSIMVDDYEIPLSVNNGLLLLNIREPTVSEQEKCVRIIMTADSIWDVGIYDEDAGKVIANTNTTTSADIFKNCAHLTGAHLFTMQRKFHPVKTEVVPTSLRELQAKLGWIPLNVVKKTVEATTQLAKNMRLPLRNHVKSRYPQLNRNRLRETYSTDTIFSPVPAVHTGETCMQVFYGKSSKFCKGYGMKTESLGPEMLETFIAEVGAPYGLMNDNTKMETSEAWKKILRKYNVKPSTTEPYHPQQNAVERRIQDVKRVTVAIMDHVNVPEELWLLATYYAIYLLNHTANSSLGWITPIEKAFGVTPDISAITQFSFYEPIYYMDRESSFPHTKELPGRFVGIAESTGDAMTYRILTSENKIISRSVIRSALPMPNMPIGANINFRALDAQNVEE